MPLPLEVVGFERYMLADDSPRHPMTFTIRLLFSGRLDEAAFRQALHQALERHPLLWAHVAGHRPGVWTWQPNPAGPQPYVDIADESVPFRFPGGERIDLRTTDGLRVWVRTGSERVEVRFQYHHSCSDGIGAYQLIEDTLCNYDHLVRPGARASQLGPIDTERLAIRTTFGLSWPRFLLRLPAELWGVVVGFLTFFVFARPRPLATPERPAPGSDDALTLLDYPAHTFTVDQSRRIREAARAARATINDLLLGEMLLAMQQWNVEHDPRLRGACLRIMVPMNLRGPGDEQLPCTNVVAMVFVDRRVAWFKSPAFLLRTVVWEMAFLKYFRFGLSFIRWVEMVTWSKWLTDLFLTRAEMCYATSVLSNLGRLFHDTQMERRDGKLVAGELVLERIESAPPVRHQTATSFSSLSYADRLTVIMNYDRYHFTPQAARDHLAVLVRRLEALGGTSPAKAAASAEQGAEVGV